MSKLKTMVCKESFKDRGFHWEKGDTVLVSIEKQAILIGACKGAECFKFLTDENFKKLKEKIEENGFIIGEDELMKLDKKEEENERRYRVSRKGRVISNRR